MGINVQETRVRLSAEGVADIVRAFQTMTGAGKESAHELGEAFKQLKEQFAEVGKNLLGGLSIAYAVDELRELFKQSLENADSLTRLSKQTNLSTAVIQAFGRAAVETGSNTESANAGLVKLTQSLGKAQIGGKDAQAALRDLGITNKDLSGLNSDQKLELIAQRLARIPDPGRRARDELGLFGKSGNDLDQALVKLAEEGIAGLVNRLRELGVYLDQEAIQRFQTLGDKLRDANLAGRGLGIQFLTGLAPALVQVNTDLEKTTAAGEGFRLVGVAVGTVIKSLVLALDVAGKTIGLNWALIMNHISGAARSAALAVKGHFIDASKEAVNTFKRDAEIIKSFGQDVADAAHGLFSAQPAAESTASNPQTDNTPAAPDEALFRARYNLLVAQLDSELKLFQAHNQLIEAQDKAAYDRGEISLKEYFARRERIINEDFDKRIATLKSKLAAQEKLPTATGVSEAAATEEKRVERAKLLGEIQDLNAQRLTAIQTEENSLREQALAITQALQRAEEQLLILAGKRAEADRLTLQTRAQELDRTLKSGGVSAPDRAAAVQQFTDQGNAKIDFDAESRKASATLKQLDAQTRAIQSQVNQGQLFSLQGEQRILDVQREQLPVLRQEADAMMARAQASHDPTLIAQAEQFKAKVDEIGASVNTAGQYMKELKAGVEQSIGAGLNTFLDQAILKTKGLGQAFDSAMKQIFTDLAKLALQIEEQKLLKWLFGGGGGGGGLGSLFGGSDTGGSVGGVVAASGGYIRGPGTTTSDSIPALLSDREFVVNADATQRPGVLPFLQALNGGPRGPAPLTRFAAGGLVGGSVVRASAAAPTPVVLRVHPDALHMTLREWFQREIADIAAKR